MKATPEYIIKKLCEYGFPTYLVGGAVRDLFLGYEPKDEDIVTQALPEIVIKIFNDHEIKTVGQSFLVVLVDDIEVATFRTERCRGLSDKNLEVYVADTIEEDLSRRDLTINACALCIYTGEIIDPFNGLKDLNNKMIRFVGDPEKRIFEDPNRIIRACRFLALLDGKFETKTEEALKYYSHMLAAYVHPERIRLEVLKAMKIQKASLFFKALHDIDALQYIFPSLEDEFAYDFHGPHHLETIIDHSFMTGDFLSTKNPLLKLSGYLHDVGKPISCQWNSKTNDVKFGGHDKSGASCLRFELSSLRFSNEEIDYICGLVRLHMRNFDSPKATRRTLKNLHDYGINWKDLYKLKLCDSKANSKSGDHRKERVKEDVLRITGEINRKAPSKFSDLEINGFDIMNITGLGPCKEIGIIKEYLLDRVLDEPELNTSENLKKILVESLPTIEFMRKYLSDKVKEDFQDN